MSSILVVEDKELITTVINENLRGEEYRAVIGFNSKDAVQFVFREIPNLIILDMMHPDMDGYAIVRLLRDHPKCMHIPIMMVNGSDSLTQKVRAYETGVDSYMTRPYNPVELMVQIHRQLQRSLQCTLSPLTRLPGGLQLERAIDCKLRTGHPWSVLYLDLDNFKAYNDVYGFLSGNDMILLVAHICQRAVYEYGNTDDFVGHVGGDDFVIVTTPDCEKRLCRKIRECYNTESAVLYRQEDLERGTISGVDRKGRPYQFPLVSLSIGVVSDQLCCSHSVDEVGTLTAEAKRRAKQSSDNTSHIFIEGEKVAVAARVRTVQPVSSFRLTGHLGHRLYHIPHGDALAEF